MRIEMKEKINEPIYTLTGIVIHGRGIGKHVGTPTANIEIAKNTFLPKTGVYVADILLSGKIYYVLLILERALHLIMIALFQSKHIFLILIRIYTGVR